MPSGLDAEAAPFDDDDDDNVPNPTFALAVSDGFVAGLPKLNVGGAAADVWFD